MKTNSFVRLALISLFCLPMAACGDYLTTEDPCGDLQYDEVCEPAGPDDLETVPTPTPTYIPGRE